MDTTLADAVLKTALRARLRAWRKGLSPATRRRAADRAAARAWWESRRLRAARTVALTWPAGSELDPRPLLALLARRGRAVALPEIRGGGQMLFHCVPRALAYRPHRLTRAMRHGPHGLRHPPASWTRLPRARLDAMVLPLLGFDARGRRLGQGGGYYDRFLAPVARRARPWRLGLAFAGQEVEEGLPAEPHDVPLHAIATETGVRRAG